MAAHRYWRAVAFDTYAGTGLALSEFHLLSALTRVDAAASLTANIVPSSGALSNLKDDDTATSAAWTAAESQALILSWDFGVGGSADVTDIRLGSVDSRLLFLQHVKLQWSDDAVAWTDLVPTFTGIAWPGVRTKTSSEAIGAWNRGHHFGAVTLTTGGTVALHAPGSVNPARPAVPFKSSGVLQIEWEWITTSISGSSAYVGFTEYEELINPQNGRLGWSPRGWAWSNAGIKVNAGTDTAYGAGWTLGDVLGAVVDFAAGSITFYKNGASQGVAFTGIVFGDLYPGVKTGNTGPTYQTRVRTKGFTFPVAGASPWEDRETSIAVEKVRGKTRFDTEILVATLATVPKPIQTRIESPVPGRRDYLTGVLGRGIGRVKGTTKDKGTPNVPVSEKVVLHRQIDGMVIRTTWSAPGTGAYSFDYVDELQAYYVVSFDHDLNFRAVIADNLTLAGGGVELIA